MESLVSLRYSHCLKIHNGSSFDTFIFERLYFPLDIHIMSLGKQKR